MKVNGWYFPLQTGKGICGGVWLANEEEEEEEEGRDLTPHLSEAAEAALPCKTLHERDVPYKFPPYRSPFLVG